MFGPSERFGANQFGQQQTTAPPTFGQPVYPFGEPPAFGPQNTTSLFGATSPASVIFGQTAAPAFGSTAAPTFGGIVPTQWALISFGQTSSGFDGFGGDQQSTSLFGPTANPINTGFGGSTFGRPSTSACGQPQPALGANGTAIAKYQPHAGPDSRVKHGQKISVSTLKHCITAMKEYEDKSLEELRLEDYMANRKGPQTGSALQSGGLFGTAAPSTGLFGAHAVQAKLTTSTRGRHRYRLTATRRPKMATIYESNDESDAAKVAHENKKYEAEKNRTEEIIEQLMTRMNGVEAEIHRLNRSQSKSEDKISAHGVKLTDLRAQKEALSKTIELNANELTAFEDDSKSTVTMLGPPERFGPNTFARQQTAAQAAVGQSAKAFETSPAFGQQNTTSLFGVTMPTTGVSGQVAAPAFGSTAAPTFGRTAHTQLAFRSFEKTQPTSTTLFGQTSYSQANKSLFGQLSTSGLAKRFIRFGCQQSTSLFGQAANPMNTGFGDSTFGRPSTSALEANGTAIAKYQPLRCKDTLAKNGQTISVSTCQHCITAMKEYEDKSFEELRLEDYARVNAQERINELIDLVTSQNNQLAQQQAESVQKLESCVQGSNNLKSKLIAAEAELFATEETVKAKSEEVMQLKQEITTMAEKHSTEMEEQQLKHDKVLAEIETLGLKLNELQTELISSTEIQATNREETDVLKEKLVAAKLAYENEMTKQKEFETEKKRMEEIIEQLTAEKNGMEAEILRLNRSQSKFEDEIAALEVKMTDLHAEKDALNKIVELNANEQLALNTKMGQLIQASADAEHCFVSELKTAENRIKELNDTIEKYSGDQEQLQSVLGIATDRSTADALQIADLTSEVSKLTASEKALRSENAQLNEAKSASQTLAQELYSDMDEIRLANEKKIEELHTQYAEESARFEGEIDELIKKRDSIDADLQLERDKLATEKASFEQKLQELTEEKMDSLTALAQMKLDHIEELIKVRSEAAERETTLEREKEQLEAERSNLKIEIEQITSKNGQLEKTPKENFTQFEAESAERIATIIGEKQEIEKALEAVKLKLERVIQEETKTKKQKKKKSRLLTLPFRLKKKI